jgi:hypothetical protein
LHILDKFSIPAEQFDKLKEMCYTTNIALLKEAEMTKLEKTQLVFGVVLLATGLIWPVPQNDRSFMGMVIVPMMLVVSLIFLGPVAFSRRREIWSFIRDFYRGQSSQRN